jgi:hypothetical protein
MTINLVIKWHNLLINNVYLSKHEDSIYRPAASPLPAACALASQVTLSLGFLGSVWVATGFEPTSSGDWDVFGEAGRTGCCE